MVGPPDFTTISPFNVNDDCSYTVDNTTPELLKFQLQELYRSKLKDLLSNLPSLNILHSHVLQGAFNDHLQSSINQGEVQLRETSVPSLSSTPGSNSEDERGLPLGEGFHENPNYLNLKILIENSVFDTSKVNKDAILSLTALKNVKKNLEEQIELKAFLASKYAVSQQFLSTVLLNSDSLEITLDQNLLLRAIKLTNELSKELLDATEKIDALNLIISNHNLACLVLGYVEDVKLSSLSKNSDNPKSRKTQVGSSTGNTSPYKNSKELDNVSQSFESLFSHVVSIAAQRKVTLPPPPSPSSSKVDVIKSRTDWTKECIDTILQAGSLTDRDSSTVDSSYASDSLLPNGHLSTKSPSPGISPSRAPKTDEMSLADYKTALRDLRFAHQYLTKEYELSKENSTKVIQDNRKKIAVLENELKNSRDNSEVDLSEDYDSTKAKDSEIAKLKKEIYFLKIDKLGLKGMGSPTRGNGLSPVSSNLTMGSNDNLVTTSIGGDIDDNAGTLPLHAAFAARPSSYGNSTSTAILRKEFKKIISDVQDKYELKLSEERIRRRQLTEELKTVKNHQNTPDN